MKKIVLGEGYAWIDEPYEIRLLPKADHLITEKDKFKLLRGVKSVDGVRIRLIAEIIQAPKNRKRT